MRKKELALEVIERLKKEYPDADCSLEYDQAWKLLVSVRLAAQCTDARVNVVVEKLYEKYPDVASLAEDFTGHGGGDDRMVVEFLELISGEKEESSYVTSLERSLESHYCALAAEYSRTHGGRPVKIDEFAK